MRREDTIDYNIKVAWHAIYRMYNQQAVKHQITTSIGYVLLNIDSKEGTPATKIAPLMGMESRSLTRMLKSMEEKGLICRKPDLTDRRSIRIFLTEKGREKREVSRNTVLAFNNYIEEEIPSEKLQAFLDVTKKIIKDIELDKIFELNSKTAKIPT